MPSATSYLVSMAITAASLPAVASFVCDFLLVFPKAQAKHMFCHSVTCPAGHQTLWSLLCFLAKAKEIAESFRQELWPLSSRILTVMKG